MLGDIIRGVGAVAEGYNKHTQDMDEFNKIQAQMAQIKLAMQHAKIKEERETADYTRGQAKERYAFDRGEAQQAIKQNDYAGADTILRGAQADRNTYLGRNEVAPTLIGTPTGATIERARPTPSFQGPMPGVPEIDATKPDYNNPANRLTIDRRAGYTPPKTEYKAYNPGDRVYPFDGETGALKSTDPALTIPMKPAASKDPKMVRSWDAAAGAWTYKPMVEGGIYPDKPGTEKAPKDFNEGAAWNLVDSRLEASKPLAGLDAQNNRVDLRTGQPLEKAWSDYEAKRQAEYAKVLSENGYRPGGGYSTTQGPQQRDPFGAPPSFNQPSRGGFRPRGVVGTGGTARWAPIVKQASEQFGVPAEIITAVMRQESGGQPGVVSPAGAIGLMQFMPGTARAYGIDPRDPEQAILAGAKHLKGLYAKFGKWSDAIAAYNAGADDTPAVYDKRGKLIKRIGPFARSGDDPKYRVWENPSNSGYAETRNYVKSIKADLKRQGIEISAAEAEQVAGLLDKYGLAPGATNA
mgnify:CR=1 FL=1